MSRYSDLRRLALSHTMSSATCLRFVSFFVCAPVRRQAPLEAACISLGARSDLFVTGPSAIRAVNSGARTPVFGIGRAALPMLLSGCREDSQDTPGDFDRVSALVSRHVVNLCRRRLRLCGSLRLPLRPEASGWPGMLPTAAG